MLREKRALGIPYDMALTSPNSRPGKNLYTLQASPGPAVQQARLHPGSILSDIPKGEGQDRDNPLWMRTFRAATRWFEREMVVGVPKTLSGFSGRNVRRVVPFLA